MAGEGALDPGRQGHRAQVGPQNPQLGCNLEGAVNHSRVAMNHQHQIVLRRNPDQPLEYSAVRIPRKQM